MTEYGRTVISRLGEQPTSHTARANSSTPATTAIAKRTATLLRDARSVQRRLNTLAAAVIVIDDPSLPRITAAEDAVERLVVELGHVGVQPERELAFAPHGSERS
ncbi:MAG: hypothetical protein ACYCZN_10895 [Candidatus Dormibacteria bacterium]